MIHLTAQTHILVATEPADFRCGIDGFVARCRYHLQQDPRSGSLYVFTNRARTMLRILVYDQSGYWLCTKRLSTGKFAAWPRQGGPVNALQAHQLRQLLSGALNEELGR